MPETIFDKIIDGSIPSYTILESKDHLAFLTPFANTKGVTVVIPKQNLGDNVFNLSLEDQSALFAFAQEVVELLKKGLGVKRVAMVFEGTGVAHVHAKLYPLHGLKANSTDIWSTHQEFYPSYPGYITTVEGPMMSEVELLEVQKMIRGG